MQMKPLKAQDVKWLVVHCSASRCNRPFTVERLIETGRQRFGQPSYHYYVRRNGYVVPILPESVQGVHAVGYNHCSIAVCYEGGLDENGKAQTPLMGCYGIGVDRTLASIIEAHHDDNGIIWTMSTAPFHVVIIPIKYDGKMKEVADALYTQLSNSGLDVLLDDRNERPGVKFADMDLIGIPLRIVVGEKNLPNVEIKERGKNESTLTPTEEAANVVTKIVQDALFKLDNE